MADFECIAFHKNKKHKTHIPWPEDYIKVVIGETQLLTILRQALLRNFLQYFSAIYPFIKQSHLFVSWERPAFFTKGATVKILQFMLCAVGMHSAKPGNHLNSCNRYKLNSIWRRHYDFIATKPDTKYIFSQHRHYKMAMSSQNQI